MGHGVSFLEAEPQSPAPAQELQKQGGKTPSHSSSCHPLQRSQAEPAATLRVAPAGQNVLASPARLGGCPWLIRLEMEKEKALTLSEK